MTAEKSKLRKRSGALLSAEAAKLNDGEKLKVAKVIISERIRRRLSQTALALKLGVTQQQISKLENGDFDNLGTLQKVLSVLGYHVRVSAIPLHREAHTHSSRN